MKNLLSRGEKYVTVQNKCSNIQPSNTIHFVIRVRRWRAVRLSWTLGFCRRAAASKMPANNSYHESSFLLKISFFIRPQKQKSKTQKSRYQQRQLGNHMNVFLALTDRLSPLKTLTSLSEITLYILSAELESFTNTMIQFIVHFYITKRGFRYK